MHAHPSLIGRIATPNFSRFSEGRFPRGFLYVVLYRQSAVRYLRRIDDAARKFDDHQGNPNLSPLDFLLAAFPGQLSAATDSDGPKQQFVQIHPDINKGEPPGSWIGSQGKADCYIEGGLLRGGQSWGTVCLSVGAKCSELRCTFAILSSLFAISCRATRSRTCFISALFFQTVICIGDILGTNYPCRSSADKRRLVIPCSNCAHACPRRAMLLPRAHPIDHTLLTCVLTIEVPCAAWLLAKLAHPCPLLSLLLPF